MQVRTSRAACAAIIAAAGCFGLSANAAPTWTVQASFNGTATPTSQTRTARGIALSPDGSEEYLGFIQGTGVGSTAVRDYSSGILSGVNPTPDNSAGLSGGQPKGVAVDDRGNVFATDSNSASGITTQKVIVLNSTLGSSSTFNTQTEAHGYQLGGIAVEKVGADYLLYVASNKGNTGSGGTIDIYNVDTPSSPTFVSTINLHTATGGNVNAQLNGLDVGSDGTIYATADDSTNTNIRGDTVYKIDNTGAITGSLSVTEAMDDVLYNGKLYVAEYNSDNSAIGVVDPSTMTLSDTWTTGFTRTSTPTDSGYAGITVNSAGQLYVVDETYTSTTDPALDRVLVSSALPEPASLSLLGLGGLGLLRRRRA